VWRRFIIGGHFPRRRKPRHGKRLATFTNMGWFAMGESVTVRALTERVRGEFNKMPGLQLTIPQAARLWGLELDDCHHVVNALVAEAFLRLTPGGTIVRASR
jgi:hypothetical protein